LLLCRGAWNGFGGDFASTRVEAIKHQYANAYALEQGRLRSCKDERIELIDDVRHRQTKGAATDMFDLKPPASHSDYTAS